ncbi:MAG: ankyrin repeat domain-containing protein [Proteobacteria bacterium]|nr:ankyrin repeat domain-containing protein [Pseudomonadota bacterium]
MLPVIPIVVAVASAAVLIKRKRRRDAQKSNYEKLVRYVRTFEVPVDSDGNFNPDAILSNGNPLMFEFMVKDELIVSLLEYGANPNICNSHGVPALVYAAKWPHLANAVSILLKYGANPNAMDSEGKTAIFYAKSGDVLMQLYDAGADLNAIDCTGKTALFYSAKNNTTKFFVDLGADVNVKDNEGKTAVFYMTSKWDLICLKIAGADFNVVDNMGKTALFYALLSPHANDLLECGADVNARDRDGKTVIFYAASKQVFEMLIRAGGDINAVDNTGKTALFYAFANRTINLFLICGRTTIQGRQRNCLNVHVRDKEGKTVLFYITGEKDFPYIRRMEWIYELDVEKTDGNGNHFEYYEQYKAYRKTENLCLSKDDFFCAIACDDIKRTEQLIAAGIDPNMVFSSGNSVQLAIFSDSPQLIELLVKSGGDIDYGSMNETPLAHAINCGYVECVKKLLELGANPKLAIGVIHCNSNPAIKEILKQYNVDDE